VFVTGYSDSLSESMWGDCGLCRHFISLSCLAMNCKSAPIPLKEPQQFNVMLVFYDTVIIGILMKTKTLVFPNLIVYISNKHQHNFFNVSSSFAKLTCFLIYLLAMFCRL